MAGALLGSPLGLGSPELSEGRPTVTSEQENKPGVSDVPWSAPEGFWQVRPTRVGGSGPRVLPSQPGLTQPSPAPGARGPQAYPGEARGCGDARGSTERREVSSRSRSWFSSGYGPGPGRPERSSGFLSAAGRAAPLRSSPVLSSPPCAQGLGARAGWGAAAGDSGCAARPLAMAPRTSLRGAVTARRARRARLCPARPRLVRAATCGPRSRRSPGRRARPWRPTGAPRAAASSPAAVLVGTVS